ncbi:hypothetical protein CK203_056256 [Vitis vinifera]|uniref:DUF659 domain-containing protein n=1 Tax=Vitis vinifera TaxID=29760 RepID=A0A438GJH5_VITVI|nr:hypothetical protein CK203_056256 [Vitis vinifera]
MKQTTTNDAYKKESRERACMLITRWMYEAAIPFNAVTYPSFQPMIEAIGQYGVGMKGPTLHEVRVTNLKKELALTKDLMKDHIVEWGKNGCSIMSYGWTDMKERTLVNFLVNCSKGTMFMQSINDSSMIKKGENMFELLDKWIKQVGEENVIQVITDNHSSYVMTWRLLELKRWHLYWTPCVAHCLDLMLEDIGKLPNIKRTLERAISLNEYIYNRSGLLNMMKQFTGQRELLRPAKTRFAVSGPLVRVLHLVDGEKKAPMRYIYEAMNRAKDIILNGGLHMELQLQICKAYEFLQIHSKRRNRLVHQHLNDLVYIKYNQALKRRYNEWLIGRMEDEDSHGGDFVFDDDNLTWDDVARAIGAEEARFDTRARARTRASSSIIPPTRGIASSSKTLSSHSLIDEDEDGDMVDSTNEEDGEGYKCDDGNDDDDDFVDLDEE